MIRIVHTKTRYKFLNKNLVTVEQRNKKRTKLIDQIPIKQFLQYTYNRINIIIFLIKIKHNKSYKIGLEISN